MSNVQAAKFLPGALNFEVYQGDDFYPLPITVKDSAGAGIALSDAKMMIKGLDGTLLKTLAVGSGITITNPGSIQLSIAKAETAAWVPTSYEYDLEVTYTSNGKTRTILSDLFTVTKQRTT